MKLKDILPYCLDYPKTPGGGTYGQKYYWILNGLDYQIEKVETFCRSEPLYLNDGYQYNYKPFKDSYTNILHLGRYRDFDTKSYTNDKDNHLTVNLDNEIIIFDNFIIVHKTDISTNHDIKLFHTHDYWIDANTRCHTQYYVLGLMRQGCVVNNLRTVFKDLIFPPVQPKPAELTLDERVDDLISELMKDSKTMAIKKLKRMLNERL